MALTLFSCEKSTITPLETDSSLPASVLERADVSSAKGMLNMITLKGQGKALVVDNEKQFLIFRLQGDDIRLGDFTAPGRVEFSEKELLFWNGSALPVKFEVNDDYNRLLNQKTGAETMGYGLAVQVINKSQKATKYVGSLLKTKSFPNGDAHAKGCDQGGVGSTSCSTTNSGDTCSVSCGSGYYAC